MAVGGGGAPRGLVLRLCRALVAAASLLVPRGRRGEWREEWEAELWEVWRRAGRLPARYGRPGSAVVRFVAGAVPHALWELKGGWTMDLLYQDVKYATRVLLRAPLYLVVAVLTLALGIGANATIFSMVNALLLRSPAAITRPDRLVQIGRGRDPARFDNYSYPFYLDLRDRTEVFGGVAAYAGAGVILGRGAESESVPAQLVSGNYFDVLGVRPVLGRGFGPEDVQSPGAAAVVVIGHGLWQRRFGGDPAVVGRMLAVNGRSYEIVGVAPERFGGADVFRGAPAVWLPVTMADAVLSGPADRLGHRGLSWLWLVGRLKPGVDLARAAASTRALVAHLDEEHPDLGKQGVQLVAGVGVRPAERAQALVISRLLLGMVALVLLIACANLASIALARGAAREGELGVRLALGAGRPRLVRQLLTESLLVAALGAGAALLIAAAAARQLPGLIPYDVSIGFEPDGRVLAFTLGVAVVAGILFGLLPALSSSRPDVARVLGAAGGRTGTRRAGWIRRALVVGQLALAFLLLSGAALLTRSVLNARGADPGFRTDDVIALTIDLDRRGTYDETRGRELLGRLRERTAALPGVVAVGAATTLPIVDFQPNRTALPPGELPSAGPPPAPVFYNIVDAGYFEALGIPLVRGRAFDEREDRTGTAPVVVVNERFAARFWPDDDAVGQALPFGEPGGATARVVGVVRDSRTRSLHQPPVATVYYPLSQRYSGGVTILARTAAPPGAALPAAAGVVEALDPGLPLLRGAVLRELIGRSLRETHMTATLAAVFGLVALVLALVGIYGLMAYTVAQRTREFGVRLALGARARDVQLLVLRQGAGLATAGLALGVAAALGTLRLIGGLLYGVAPTDPGTLAAIAVLLTLVVFAASWIPARRATRTDPVTSLDHL